MQKPKTLEYKWGGTKLWIPKGSEAVLYETYLIGEYDSLTIGRSDVVLDAGAYVGDFAVKAARKAKEVIAVEPMPSSFELLRKNVEANSLKNVVLVNKALWKEARKLRLTGEGGGAHEGSEGISVDAITVDDLMDELGMRASVVKMDVEGAERYALRGEYLKDVREIPAELHGENVREIPPYLEHMGFEVREMGIGRSAVRAAKNALLHVPSLLDAERKSSGFALKNALRLALERKNMEVFSRGSDLKLVYARKPTGSSVTGK
ncbi:FkbM family methyltransferase [Tardisphaera miroshnichenkoae]